MLELSVERWKQEHPIYLWKYVERLRNYPGWHLTASDVACRATAGLLDLMLRAQSPSQKELRLTPPTPAILGVPNARHGGQSAASITVETMRISFPRGNVDPTHWHIETEDRGITLTLGEERLQTLRKAFTELPEGTWDYCIGPVARRSREERFLWFWHFAAR